MKTITDVTENIRGKTVPSRRFRLRLYLVAAFTLLLLDAAQNTALAGSAKWKLNPVDPQWNSDLNWTPATVPNGSSDIATFGVSNTTGVLLTAGTTVAEIVFNAGASPYTVNVGSHGISIYTGISNNSGITQTFDIGNPGSGCGAGAVAFFNAATAGSGTTFNLEGGLGCPFNQVGSHIFFFNSSSADHATFVCQGGTRKATARGGGGSIRFLETSTAGSAMFITNPSKSSSSDGGSVEFSESSTASNGTVINYGGFAGKLGGSTSFQETSDAGNAILIAKTGFNGGAGGLIRFVHSSTGGTARVEVFGNGNLDITEILQSGITIGSIEGSGQVFLGKNNLRVGANNLNTTFSGVISDGGQGGSLTKIGVGKLILSNPNSYAGGTIVNNGKLVVSNTSGSGTGSGPVQVNFGTLRGHGIIAGTVTVGTGSSSGAILLPDSSFTTPANLTINSALTLRALSTYKCVLNLSNQIAGKVTALGVTISANTTFAFMETGTGTLSTGSVFTVINNTSASSISGTFSNLPDGSTFTVSGNTFRADYQGGDGNDLTLTVVP